MGCTECPFNGEKNYDGVYEYDSYCYFFRTNMRGDLPVLCKKFDGPRVEKPSATKAHFVKALRTCQYVCSDQRFVPNIPCPHLQHANCTVLDEPLRFYPQIEACISHRDCPVPHFSVKFFDENGPVPPQIVLNELTREDYAIFVGDEIDPAQPGLIIRTFCNKCPLLKKIQHGYYCKLLGFEHKPLGSQTPEPIFPRFFQCVVLLGEEFQLVKTL